MIYVYEIKNILLQPLGHHPSSPRISEPKDPLWVITGINRLSYCHRRQPPVPPSLSHACPSLPCAHPSLVITPSHAWASQHQPPPPHAHSLASVLFAVDARCTAPPGPQTHVKSCHEPCWKQLVEAFFSHLNSQAWWAIQEMKRG